jgi:hypothetical protein
MVPSSCYILQKIWYSYLPQVFDDRWVRQASGVIPRFSRGRAQGVVQIEHEAKRRLVRPVSAEIGHLRRRPEHLLATDAHIRARIYTK